MAIKVLHIFAPNFTSRFGGPIYNWKFYFSNWNNPDVEHYVLDYEKNQLVDSREVFNFEYPPIQKRTSKWERIIWAYTLYRSINKQKGKFDILHLHVLWWAGLLVGPWAKRENIPAIYESVLLGSDTPGGIRKERFGGLKTRCLMDFKAILAISEALAEDYWKSGFSRMQVFTLMNCIDVELFSPIKSIEEKTLLRQELNLPQNATILLFVGSIIERKGVDILIRAFIEAISQFSDLYLLIVGPKNIKENPSLDEGFVNDLTLFINKHNLSNNVTFTGLMQDRQELAKISRASDIFVFPSRNEGLPNVVLEAMASALPVVVSHLPGLEKTIHHDENGLFVPIGDVDALSVSIIKLSKDPLFARKIGHSARKYILKEHSFSIWQSQITNFYKGLL